MMHHDPQIAGDAEREALATLIARFSADRDALAAGMQRTEAAVRELAARLDDVAARAGEAVAAHELDPLRSELGRLEALAASLRDELAEVRGALAAPREEAASDGVAAAALMTALDEVRAELRDAQRVALASGERAALAQAGDLERSSRALEALRASLGPLRDDAFRRIEETEARLDVRLDSVVAGVEAETRAVRDALWDRVSGAEQRLQQAEAVLSGLRVEVLQTAAQALEGVVAGQGEIEELRTALGATDERLAALERQQAARGGLAGMVECVRDELVAAVMMVVSIGAVVGRLTLSLVR
jgi:predicted  nucleic acid-binding Zn-ribbon protein